MSAGETTTVFTARTLFIVLSNRDRADHPPLYVSLWNDRHRDLLRHPVPLAHSIRSPAEPRHLRVHPPVRLQHVFRSGGLGDPSAGPVRSLNESHL